MRQREIERDMERQKKTEAEQRERDKKSNR